jgi:hypothetical protein
MMTIVSSSSDMDIESSLEKLSSQGDFCTFEKYVVIFVDPDDLASFKIL